MTLRNPVLLPRAPKALPRRFQTGFIEKRSGGYRARYRDPLGRLTSETFTRKADAERWTKEMEVAIERGDWLDPRSAQVPLATWAEQFLSLAGRLSPSTQETYERDLRKYILPRFGAYRLGRLPADEIENKVRVTEQMIRLKGGRWHRKKPKTPASVRSITMSAVTAELLADLVDRFVLAGPEALVFATRWASPLIRR